MLDFKLFMTGAGVVELGACRRSVGRLLRPSCGGVRSERASGSARSRTGVVGGGRYLSAVWLHDDDRLVSLPHPFHYHLLRQVRRLHVPHNRIFHHVFTRLPHDAPRSGGTSGNDWLSARTKRCVCRLAQPSTASQVLMFMLLFKQIDSSNECKYRQVQMQ